MSPHICPLQLHTSITASLCTRIFAVYQHNCLSVYLHSCPSIYQHHRPCLFTCMYLQAAPNAFLPSIIPEEQNVSMRFAVKSDIVSLEHVVMVFNMRFVDENEGVHFHRKPPGVDKGSASPRRGTVTMSLTSPLGTTSTLLPLRQGDISSGSYSHWPLMSVHFWGEDPEGTWTVSVAYMGKVEEIRVEIPSVTLYGTSTVPEAVSRIPSQCSAECDSTRGCSAEGAEFCDACAQLRMSSTLECVSSCPEGLDERNGYCYDSSQSESSCDDNFPTSSPTTDDSSSSINPTHTVSPATPSGSAYPTATTTPTAPTPDTPGRRSTAVRNIGGDLLILFVLAITILA